MTTRTEALANLLLNNTAHDLALEVLRLNSVIAALEAEREELREYAGKLVERVEAHLDARRQLDAAVPAPRGYPPARAKEPVGSGLISFPTQYPQPNA